MAGGVIQSYHEFAAAMDELETLRQERHQHDEDLRVPHVKPYPYRNHVYKGPAPIPKPVMATDWFTENAQP
ncbi:unnamed protein product [marine sediment metagenome]|uniref:Uncharacterized protein n=1 Tax=marine sediment metagenome TaxID=412755 RepID=X0TC56_9ZZZZ